MIKVLLAEDQTIVRRGITTLLGFTPDVRVTSEARDGAEALAMAQQQRPDVAVLDIRMPRVSGTEVIAQWNRVECPIPAILLTTFDDDALFLEAVQVGARGFLLKDVSLDRLADAIRAVAQGQTIWQPALTERIIRIVKAKGTSFHSTHNPEKLTPRESDVLRLVLGGYSNREIGKALRISEGVVKNQVSVILSKFGTRDRTRAALRAIELGLLE